MWYTRTCVCDVYLLAAVNSIKFMLDTRSVIFMRNISTVKFSCSVGGSYVFLIITVWLVVKWNWIFLIFCEGILFVLLTEFLDCTDLLSLRYTCRDFDECIKYDARMAMNIYKNKWNLQEFRDMLVFSNTDITKLYCRLIKFFCLINSLLNSK